MAKWILDSNFGSYPEGARSKDAIFPPDEIGLDIIIPKRRYLYKRSDKRYPDQFWGEVAAYQIGCLLNVTVPPAFAATNSDLGDCGALIEWFYEDGKANFNPGGSYMQKLMPEFDRKKGELHNFQYIDILCRAFSQAHVIEEPWIEAWADLFLFDAMIGNTDRHQDNWGLIRNKGQARWRLAPLFDNGTSLGHERWEKHVQAWTEKDYVRYITKGKHHIRWMRGDESGCPHIELLVTLVAFYPQIRNRMLEKLLKFDVTELARILDVYEAFEIRVPLTKFRKDLYIRLTDVRRKKILAALQ
ncbi:HipA domain-containing protein [Massilia sp. GCM10023247]|uniref:HipA domain-containing protein n=1 Tax=Massilia sp. GCM10023247 TaxID=3252643 RepID=UPI0036237387